MEVLPAGAIDVGRVLRFEAIHNFRDYGGYGAGRDGRLRRNLLFRSGQHWGATPGDLARVAAIELETVVDLRGPMERAYAPCPRPEGFCARVVRVEEDTRGLAPHVEAGAALTPEAARRAMLDSYANMPFRRRMIPALVHYFEALSLSQGPSLIHCMAGKDRTGFAVALFHRALGVHPDDIVADYLLTNTAGSNSERIAAGARHIREVWGERISDQAIAVLMGVSPEYLAAAFAAIDERHGDLATYLSEVLGVTQARRDAIAERVLE